jgi:hypothetical protein
LLGSGSDGSDSDGFGSEVSDSAIKTYRQISNGSNYYLFIYYNLTLNSIFEYFKNVDFRNVGIGARAGVASIFSTEMEPNRFHAVPHHCIIPLILLINMN